MHRRPCWTWSPIHPIQLGILGVIQGVVLGIMALKPLPPAVHPVLSLPKTTSRFGMGIRRVTVMIEWSFPLDQTLTETGAVSVILVQWVQNLECLGILQTAIITVFGFGEGIDSRNLIFDL